MSVEHKNLTGASLHEPKGVAGAGAETAYIADGAGSGAWQDPLASVNNKNLLIYSAPFADLSAASSIYIPMPLAAKVVRVVILAHAATSGTNTVTAQVVPAEATAGPALGAPMSIAMLATVINERYTADISVNNTFVLTETLKLISDGGGTGACPATVVITLDVS